MAEQQERLTYVVEIDLTNGKVKIDGLTKGFVEASTAAKKLEEAAKNVDKNLGQTASKAGLAGAAITELGRTISDSNYGMTAMANNIQQLSTLMVTLISTSGGLVNGLRLLWSAFMGPLGLIVVFQIAITYFEKLAIKKKEAEAGANNVAKAYATAATELETLLRVDNEMTDAQIENTEARIKALKEEAKVRAQIQEIQRIQSKIVELEGKEADEFVSFWQALWMEIKQIDPLNQGPGIKEPTILALLGLGREEKDRSIKALNDAIDDIIAGIDPNALRGITREKDKPGKKGKDKPLYLFPEGPAGTTFEEFQEQTKNELDVWLEAQEEKIKWDRYYAEGEKRLAELRIEMAQEEFDKKMLFFEGIGQGMVQLGLVVGRETAAGKGIAAAGALIDTYAAAAAILKNAGKTPAGGIPGYAIAQAASAVAFGLAQVRQILSVNVSRGRGSGGGASAATPAPSITPSFNIVGGSRIDQLNDTIRQELGRPQRAYVVNKDVRSAGELERNIVNGATI